MAVGTAPLSMMAFGFLGGLWTCLNFKRHRVACNCGVVRNGQPIRTLGWWSGRVPAFMVAALTVMSLIWSP